MNIIENQSVVIISQGEATLTEGKKIAEVAGRTCYHSLDRIEEGSAEKFVDRMVNSTHYAPIEHLTIYLKIPVSDSLATEFQHNDKVSKYSSVSNDGNFLYITTNYRVIVENELEDALKYQCAYIEGCHEKRLTVRLVTNLQVLGEFTRHRVLSYCVESTRYCAYSKDKFDNNVNFIRPNFGIYIKDQNVMREWEKDMERAEYAYLKLAKLGANAQECAQILPKATKCEMIVSGTILDWRHFFDLRYREVTGKVHPQMKQLSTMIHNEFKTIGLEL